MLTATLAATMALLPPAVAGAHDGAGEAVHHHCRHVHFVTFLAHQRHSTNTPTTPPSTTPATSTATVASFTEGVLTLTLADGSTVSGKVTEFTHIFAEDQNDDNGFGDHDDHHGGAWGHGDDMGGGPGPSSGDDGNGSWDHGDCDQPTSGSTSLFVPGAQIGEAELRIGSTGAFWAFLEVLPAS
jgi:hypothetical protein